MSKISVTFKMEEKLKFDLENFCDDLGMSLSTFFSVVAKKALRERKLDLDLSDYNDPFYSKKNMEILLKSKEEIEKTGGTIHEVLNG